MIDKGPWCVGFHPETKRAEGVESGDFKHDVRLALSGDFDSDQQRKEYCEALAEKLNAK